ncbi:MAG: glycosyltransferase [Flavobacteriaceae bacterium]
MKKIIVAPLNWGLGHATRCVPIINSLLKNGFVPILASDGDSLEFLQQEFPNLDSIELSTYNISYGKNVQWSLLKQTPFILKAIKKENAIIADFIFKNKDVIGIISDNRFGVRSDKIFSVYITHQINVLSGNTTFFTSKIHQKYINQFNECWVPDTSNSEFSGKLSQSKKVYIPTKFIGVLSRFKKDNLPQNIDVLIILSGPEPNRSDLEKKLIVEFLDFKGNVVLVKGKVEKEQKTHQEKNIKIYNYVLSSELQNLINSSKLIICRSGYSSIMDLAVLEKKVFFIPTKNQAEQEYLARLHQEKMKVSFSTEKNFTLKKLSEVKNYKGLKSKETELDAELFSLFHGKRKL